MPPTEPQIRVTVEDLATGETETVEVCDDYLVLAAGSCFVDGLQVYPTTGTHVLTVKRRKVAAVTTGGSET